MERSPQPSPDPAPDPAPDRAPEQGLAGSHAGDLAAGATTDPPSAILDLQLADMPRSQSEYEVELERWFRRRFGWLCVAFVTWVAIEGMWFAISLVTGMGGDPGAIGRFENSPLAQFLSVLASTGVLVIALHFYLFVRPAIETREQAVRAATRMILAIGATNFVLQLVQLLIFPRAPISPLVSILIWHLGASLILPWTPRESLRPILPLLIAWAAWTLTRGALLGQWGLTALAIAAAPLAVLPGVLVSWYRLTRHRSKFRREVSKRFFVSIRRELAQARRLHEALFPQPFDDGAFRFEYRYRPAQEIGGDFVHCWTDHHGAMHLALLDVTGHGLASAMTVNRLYGELERLRFEHPYLGPGAIIALLNRYVLLTLVQHKIFATALLVSVDPRDGSVLYANAGHPPVFLRSRNGQVRDLDSTAPMLGVLGPTDFTVDDVAVSIEPGDTLLAYTDGAFEARNRKGQKMGIARLRDAFRRQPPPAKWPDFLLALIEGFSGGATEDDILIASLTFQRRTAPTPRPGGAGESPATATAGADR